MRTPAFDKFVWNKFEQHAVLARRGEAHDVPNNHAHDPPFSLHSVKSKKQFHFPPLYLHL